MKQSKTKTQNQEFDISANSYQKIFNFIDTNFKYDIARGDAIKPMYVCSMLILTTTNKDIVEIYYKDNELNVTEENAEEYLKLLLETMDLFCEKYDSIKLMKKVLAPIFKRLDNADYRCDLIESFVELGRYIYEKIEAKEPNIIQNLYDRFYKYINKNNMKNSEWTPLHTAKIMTKLFNIYEDLKEKQEISILEPCIGAGCLVDAINNETNESIKLKVVGYEVSNFVANIAIIDSLVKQRENEIYINDFIASDITKNFDLAITNPPFTSKISGYEALHFVIKSMIHSNHGIFIFPSNQLTPKSSEISPLGREILENFDDVCKLSKDTKDLPKFSKLFQTTWKRTKDFKKFVCKATVSDITNYIVEKFHVDFIINFGPSKKVFKKGSAGEIVIIALSKLGFEPFAETKYFDFPFTSNTVKKVFKSEIFKFTQEGLNYFNDILNTTQTKELQPGKNWFREEENALFTACKEHKLNMFFSKDNKQGNEEINNDNIIKNTIKIIDEIVNDDNLTQDVKIVRLIKTIAYTEAKRETIQNIETGKLFIDFSKTFNINNYIPRVYLDIYNLDETRFKKVRLGDIFEKITTPIRYENACKPGPYLLIGGKKTGESSRIDTYDIEIKDGKFYSIALITGGYINRQTENFSCSRAACGLKIKSKYETMKNFDDINLQIINCQLSNQFSWSKGITKTLFENIEVYIYE